MNNKDKKKIEFFNKQIKDEFLGMLVEAEDANAQVYNRVFNVVRDFEYELDRDLYTFSLQDLMYVYNTIAPTKKYTTINTYNSLLVDYKNWALNKGFDVVMDVCTAYDLKTIKNYKEYFIVNDDDIDTLTKYADLSDSDFNAVIFLRLFWELDGQYDVGDILKVKIQDIHDEKFIDINGVTHKISSWLYSAIEEFSEMDNFVIPKKRGTYKILTAKENCGLIFRTTMRASTVAGEVLNYKRFSNLFYQYSTRRIGESLSINDLQMSLALKYMLSNKKSSTEMYSERRYFANIPTKVYEDVFCTYSSEKFPELYEDYLKYFTDLMHKYKQFM